jgi:sterol desaturase/sphingolipid hydroxylase (fatty acid hydroxylase superfamily)
MTDVRSRGRTCPRPSTHPREVAVSKTKTRTLSRVIRAVVVMICGFALALAAYWGTAEHLGLSPWPDTLEVCVLLLLAFAVTVADVLDRGRGPDA